ncbi:MAG: amidohydrolase family protein [Crocinitomicaceae bacterium]|nr:amidohydrolase family protein [Flavobacteriales bacterium]NQZ35541.1 amidohydrolase family protein [Crocinitomicaceae bacterium]
MSHQHHEGLSCSCCSPIFKYLLPKSTPTIKTKEDLDLSHTTEAIIFRSKEGGTIQSLEGGIDVEIEALGIKNGKIVATGSYEEVKAQMPETSTLKEITGSQTLLPGFIEPHAHIILSAAVDLAMDVGPFIGQDLRSNVSKDELYDRDWVFQTLKNKVDKMEQNNKGETTSSSWIVGRNVDPSLFIGKGNKEFNAEVLDEFVSETYPIYLVNANMHLAYINTVAINRYRASLTSELEKLKKESGSRKEIDDQIATVEAKMALISENGILHELDEMESVVEFVIKEMGDPNLASKFDESVDKLFDTASSRGVTYILDAAVSAPSNGNGFNEPEYLKQKAKSDCKVRIAGALIAENLQQFSESIESEFRPNAGDEEFNLPAVKLISDGSNQGLTGYQYNPYNCDENYVKFNELSGEELNKQRETGLFNYGYPLEMGALIQKANDVGWMVMTHANGDHAVDRTIESFRKARNSNESKEKMRNRIEHASLLSDENLKDMDNLGISPSFLIGHVGYWGWAFQQTIFGQEKSNKLDRSNSALKNNLRISFHSDYVVTPIGPLRLMEQAITRRMEGAPKEVGVLVLNEHEQITRFEALKAVTYDAAWQCHADQWVGSLEAGKCADFVILEESPLTYSSGDGAYSAKGMRNIPVLETWKGGKPRYIRKEVNVVVNALDD